jgi:hypothetical protein
MKLMQPEERWISGDFRRFPINSNHFLKNYEKSDKAGKEGNLWIIDLNQG